MVVIASCTLAAIFIQCEVEVQAGSSKARLLNH